MVKYSYDHIHLYSANPAEAARFYETMFDASRISTKPDGRVDLMIGGTMMLISPARQSGAKHTAQSAGLDHFGLTVADIQAAVRDLKAKGAQVLTDVTFVRPGVHIAFIGAPDDTRIELVQRDPE